MLRNHLSSPEYGEENNLAPSQPTKEPVFHSNPLAIPIHLLGTSIRRAGKLLPENFEGSVVQLSALYHFDRQLLQLDANLDPVIKERNNRIDLISSEVFFKDSVHFMAFERNGDSFTVNLADRHPFDKPFVILFKYALIEVNKVLPIESEYSFEIPYFQFETELKFKQLDAYYPSKEVTNVFNKITVAETGSEFQPSSLQAFQKLPLQMKLQIAISFEELSAREAISHLTIQKATIRGNEHRGYFFETVKSGAIKAEHWREMTLCLIPCHQYRHPYNDPQNCFFVRMKKIEGRSIRIDTKKSLNRSIDYHVDFIPNRIAFKACINAMKHLNNSKLLRSFFTTFQSSDHLGTVHKIFIMRQQIFENCQFEWFNHSIANNEEQKLAIKNIVNCTAYPLPQIVFGPPGTGKTSTLVECVAQILKLRPSSRILISTQSNSASDETGVRLLKYVALNKIYRLYSPSVLNATSAGPNRLLQPSSNLRNKKLEWPTKEELGHFKVVISTLVTSSRLVQSDIGKGHFDYIFVDEISCATEPEALIPIIGLGTALDNVVSNIVLLGDHKQLGPVLNSEEFSSKLGLGVSLMERMMTCKPYLKNPDYDDRYVVQLLDNYRSHPAILKFSSDEFYDGKLRAKMSIRDQKMTEVLKFLPNKHFPIIFHAVEAKCQLSGTSSFNAGEVAVVVSYVRKLLDSKCGAKKLMQSEIGIITPYLAQLRELKKAVGAKWQKIEMGTTEYFQGREKRVIIISTVKSMGGVGFLNNEKRCNVMLTRAKSLEIVIGNPKTLKQDPLWSKFISYCTDNGSFITSKNG